MTTLTLFGIKSCDSVRKARKWLEANNIDYTFHDFKAQSLDQAQFDAWRSNHELFTIINKRSTTWKKLTDAEKDAITQEQSFDAIQQNLSLIKRPVLDSNNAQVFGFDETRYQEII